MCSGARIVCTAVVSMLATVACVEGDVDASSPEVCEPTTCAAERKNCGTLSDGCAGTLDCGVACPSGQLCGGGGVANVCGSVVAGGFVIATPVQLSHAAIDPGQTLTGSGSYQNTSADAIAIADIVIALRPPGGTHAGGPYSDLLPSHGPATVPSGATVVVTASRSFSSEDFTGQWESYATYQDSTGVWHDGPSISFMVGSCVPTSCAAQGKNCGALADGCTGTLDCGVACPQGQSCGGGGVANVCGSAVALFVAPESAHLAPGATVSFSANASVTWSVQGGSTNGSITMQGLYSAPTREGDFVVVATLAENSTTLRTATVTVREPATQVIRIMPLGDSITGEPRAYRKPLWPLLTSTGMAFGFVGSQNDPYAEIPDPDSEGHPGYTIGNVAGAINGWLDTYTPDYVLLMIGTNDLAWWCAESAASVANAHAALIDQITTRAPGAWVLVASIAPMSSQIIQPNNIDRAQLGRDFNAELASRVQTRQAAGQNVVFVDIYSALALTDLRDGVHPTVAGYAKVAQTWFNALQPLLP